MRSLSMVLVMIFALDLGFSRIALIALAEQEKTEQVKKDAAKKVFIVKEKEDDEKSSGLSLMSNSVVQLLPTLTKLLETNLPQQAATEISKDEESASKQESDVKQESVDKQESAKRGSAATQKLLNELAAIIDKEKAEVAKDVTADVEAQMLEISGLIIEETMTRIGYEFYEYFFLYWEAPEVEVKDYNILISEMATPLWGSWVRVYVDETTVWSRMLRPRSEDVEDSVKQAVEATNQYLYNYAQYQFQTEDMVGTGM